MPHRTRTYIDPVDRHVGARIKLHRMSKGFTQSRLADVLGISAESVLRYEKGTQTLKPYQLVRIGAALNVDPGFFLQRAPTGFEQAAPINKGSLDHGDTRRLMTAWDAITGNARKRLLGIAVTLARACRDRDELEQLRAAAGRH